MRQSKEDRNRFSRSISRRGGPQGPAKKHAKGIKRQTWRREEIANGSVTHTQRPLLKPARSGGPATQAAKRHLAIRRIPKRVRKEDIALLSMKNASAKKNVIADGDNIGAWRPCDEH